MAGVDRLLLGEPETRDVRVAEGRARDVDVFDRMRRQAGGVLDGDDALVGRLVRECRAGNEIADRVRTRQRRAHRAVHRDQAPLGQRDARLLEAETLDVGRAPRGDDEVVRARLLACDGERHGVVGGLHVLDEDAGADRDALLLEAALGDLRDVGVLGRQHAVQALVERHVGAQAGVRRGNLRTRGTGAHDGQRRRKLGQRPRLLRADHAAAEGRAGQRLLHRARGEDDDARSDLRAVEVAADLDVGVVGDHAVTLDDVDGVLLEESRHAAGQGLDDLLAPRAHRAEVDRRVVDRDAVIRCLADLTEHVGDAQHGLGGDAGVVQAAPADLVGLDDRRLHAELSGADRSDVAAGTGADDDAVIRGVGHGPSL